MLLLRTAQLPFPTQGLTLQHHPVDISHFLDPGANEGGASKDLFYGTGAAQAFGFGDDGLCKT